jgi:hypothetical protein
VETRCLEAKAAIFNLVKGQYLVDRKVHTPP